MVNGRPTTSSPEPTLHITEQFALVETLDTTSANDQLHGLKVLLVGAMGRQLEGCVRSMPGWGNASNPSLSETERNVISVRVSKAQS